MLPNEKIQVKPVTGKSIGHLRTEWDRIAFVRQQQMASGKDLSFKHVLLPTILKLLDGCDLTRILDVGCGTGEPTKALASIAKWVTGVDMSSRSIAIAQSSCHDLSNVAFYADSVEDFARKHTGHSFTTAVASMTLMACLDLNSLVEAIAKLLVPGGCLVASITHPWFWSHYWQYADADWFRYDQEMVIEAPFGISLDRTRFTTTHVHRPFSSYTKTLSQLGFVIDRIMEPYPDESVQPLYPEPWGFPRFLVFRAISHQANAGSD